MKVFSFSAIQSLHISPLDCEAWVDDALRHKHLAILPAKTSLKPEIDEVFYNTMPVILPFAGYAGVKEVTRYPTRNPSLDSQILLYDLNTGEQLAFMDGNWITAMRTGAVAAHAVHLLANPDYSVIGMVGLGNTARSALLTIQAMNPDREFTVKLMEYKNQHELFAARFSAFSNLHFEFCQTPAQMAKGSQVILSAATVLREDICTDDCFDEGVLVVPIHTRGFTNCDLFFDKVFADDVNHVRGFRYFSRFRRFAETAEVLRGEKPGREDPRERILAYNIGIAMHDIYFAGKIYEMAKDAAPELDFKAPKEKFWI